MAGKNLIEISEAIKAHQTKICVFLEKNWVFPQTVVMQQVHKKCGVKHFTVFCLKICFCGEKTLFLPQIMQ